MYSRWRRSWATFEDRRPKCGAEVAVGTGISRNGTGIRMLPTPARKSAAGPAFLAHFEITPSSGMPGCPQQVVQAEMRHEAKPERRQMYAVASWSSASDHRGDDVRLRATAGASARPARRFENLGIDLVPAGMDSMPSPLCTMRCWFACTALRHRRILQAGCYGGCRCGIALYPPWPTPNNGAAKGTGPVPPRLKDFLQRRIASRMSKKIRPS